MAYRIRNFDNMTVHQVDDIFRRGRGLTIRDEDFTLAPIEPNLRLPIVPMPSAELVDDELESVG